MPDEFPHDVFLSHSAQDKAVVRPLAERLRADGVKHSDFGFRHSDFGFSPPCLSAHAFGSDWAQLESGTFRFRDPLNKERRFLSLHLDGALAVRRVGVCGDVVERLNASRSSLATSKTSSTKNAESPHNSMERSTNARS